MDQIRKVGIVEMIAAMLISGTIGWFVLMSGQSVAVVVFWRCLVAALALGAICFSLGLFRGGRITGRQILWSVVGGVILVTNWLLLFASFAHASIAISTAVYNTQPFIYVLFGAFVFGERLTLNKMVWLIVAFGGLLVIVQTKSDIGYTSGNYMFGIALALGAALFYALASVVTKKLTGVPPHLIAFIQVVTGMVMTMPFAGLPGMPEGNQAWFSLIALGVIHTGLMYSLLYNAIQKLPTTITAALSFVYPISAIAVDYFVYNHALHPLQATGVAAILVGAAGMSLGWRLWGGKKMSPGH